jgi:hypothetical protein
MASQTIAAGVIGRLGLLRCVKADGNRKIGVTAATDYRDAACVATHCIMWRGKGYRA